MFSLGFRNAKTKEINSAYRKLAIKWHPDKHPEGPERENAQKVFMDIAAAKEVLSDPGMCSLVCEKLVDTVYMKICDVYLQKSASSSTAESTLSTRRSKPIREGMVTHSIHLDTVEAASTLRTSNSILTEIFHCLF